MPGPVSEQLPNATPPPRDPLRVELDTALMGLIEYRKKSPILTWFFPELRRQREKVDLEREKRLMIAQTALGLVPHPQTLDQARRMGLYPSPKWSSEPGYAT